MLNLNCVSACSKYPVFFNNSSCEPVKHTTHRGTDIEPVTITVIHRKPNCCSSKQGTSTKYSTLRRHAEDGMEREPMDDGSSSSMTAEQALSGFSVSLCSALTTEGIDPLALSATELVGYLSSYGADAYAACSFPSLMLHSTGLARTSIQNLEEIAAANLATPFYRGRNDVFQAPQILLRNILKSFSSLIDSRLRSTVMALLKKYTERRDVAPCNDESVLLIKLLCLEDPISLTSVVTSFCTMPLSDDTPRPDGSASNRKLGAPLNFEVMFDMQLFGELCTVEATGPGSISGEFALLETNRFSRVEVVLDTLTLLQSMMKQARFVVRKAIRAATSIVAAATPRVQLSDASLMQMQLNTNMNRNWNHSRIYGRDNLSEDDKNVDDSKASKSNGVKRPSVSPGPTTSTNSSDSSVQNNCHHTLHDLTRAIDLQKSSDNEIPATQVQDKKEEEESSNQRKKINDWKLLIRSTLSVSEGLMDAKEENLPPKKRLRNSHSWS